MNRRRWLVRLRRFRRRARDQLLATGIQLWECISVHWITTAWIVFLLIIFIIIEQRLRRIVPREQVQEQQLQDLELIPPNRCPNDH